MKNSTKNQEPKPCTRLHFSLKILSVTMETADKDAGQSGTSERRIASMLPEIVAFLLGFGQVFEKATLDLYFVYSSCEELHPFEVDCGTDSQNDTNVQVRYLSFS